MIPVIMVSRWKFLIIYFVVLTAAGSLLAEDSPVKPLRLAFWNLEWFPGGKPEATNAEAVAQIVPVMNAIPQLDADILGFQEVLNWDAAAIATARTPDTSVQVASEFRNPEGLITSQQIILASRLPAIGAWWETWKAGNEVTPTRGFSFAAYQPSANQILLVYSVHLKSNRGTLEDNVAMREESVRQLLDHVKAMETSYRPLGTVSVAVGGDFNTTNDDPKFRLEKTLTLMEEAGFLSVWKDIPLVDRVTIPSQPSKNSKYPPFPDACFDRVYVKGATIISASVVVLDPPPSDHRPVVVQIALPESSK